MKTLKFFFVLMIAGMLVVPSVLAADWMPREELPSIVDIVVDDADFDTLETAVLQAGIAGNIAETGPFTIFAPTDAAFAKLPAGLLDDLLADKQLLTELLLYHVLEGDIGPEIAATLTEATMLNGEVVRVKVFEGGVYLNDDAKVVYADMIGMNGRVHAIDTVLLPPILRTTMAREAMGDVEPDLSGDRILDSVAEDGRFDTLLTALQVTGIDFDLCAEGAMTLFAPTDAAFAKLPAGTLDNLLKNPSTLRQILLYHLLSGDVSKEMARTIRETETIQGEMLYIKVFEGDLYLNDEAKVIEPDFLACNGRIHVIDTVLMPPSMTPKAAEEPVVVTCDEEIDYEDMTIPEVVTADCRFSTLLTALKAAGLVDTLSGEGPFTVFAPTNAAFDKLSKGTIDALLADPKGDLTGILLYHVTDGIIGTQEMWALQSETMLNGKTVAIKVFEDNLYLNDASKIIIRDVVTENGVIHVIDTVLIPPAD